MKEAMIASALIALPALGCGASATSNPSPEPSATATSQTAASTTEAPVAQFNFDASEYTNAPQRLLAVAELDAPIDEVWAYISDHDNLVEYTNGILQSADIDRSGAEEHNGVGTERECAAGEDRFVERIVYFRAPRAFAYSAFENTWGLQDHLATVVLTPIGEGRTRLEWGQHFNMQNPQAEAMMTQNLTGMMNGRVLPFFTERFGGRVISG
ncbi:MAG: SRPBCC family protein [Myxococcota bacterium]